MKSAFISIVGRPSAGKSTLLNKICGEKVSIVSPVPQTTRNKIRGILTREEGQLVFIDTPGYHNSEKKFNHRLQNLAASSLEEADLIMYVIDSSREPGAEEEAILNLLLPVKEKTIILLNKIDLDQSSPRRAVEFIEEKAPGSFQHSDIHPVSAVTGDGIEAVLKNLFEKAPEGIPLYLEDHYTDQLPEFRITEIIREKAIHLVREELPHSIYVEIADMETRKDEEGQIQKLWVRAFLLTERESQKIILVGKGGENIKKIRVEAEKELNKIFPYRVQLHLRVKVDPKWRKNERLLNKMIY